MADQLYDRRLLGATLATWRRRLEGLAELEQRVEAVKYGTDVSLVAQALRHWLLRHRVNCLASRRRSRLFQQWREKLSFREAEREGARLLVALWERADHLSEQASDFLKYRSARSLHSALLKWKERLDQQRHLESTAAAGSSSVLLANKFTHWSVATRRHQHVSSKAAELSDLSLQKRLLYRWQDRCRGKQLEKACDALLTKKRIEDTAVMFMGVLFRVLFTEHWFQYMHRLATASKPPPSDHHAACRSASTNSSGASRPHTVMISLEVDLTGPSRSHAHAMDHSYRQHSRKPSRSRSVSTRLSRYSLLRSLA